MKAQNTYVAQLTLILMLVVKGYWCLTAEDAISNFFAYFKQENPTGIPVLDLPEPMQLFTPLVTVPVTIIDGQLYGHSSIKFEYAYIDFVSLQGSGNISVPRMEITGNYSWDSFFDTSTGEMNVTMVESQIFFNFSMTINDQQIIQVEEFNVTVGYEDLMINMTGDLLLEQEIILASGLVETFFDPILQELLRQLRPRLLSEVNKQLEDFASQLPPLTTNTMTSLGVGQPSSMSATQSLSLFIRRLMLYMRYDTITMPTKSFSLIGVNVKVQDLVLNGMALTTDIRRMFCIYQEQKIYLEVMLTYPTLNLFYKLKMSSVGVDVSEHVMLTNVRVYVKMLIDPSQRTPPTIHHMGFNVGKFREIRKSRQRGFFHSLFHKAYDGVRKRVVNALDDPLRHIIQKELNTVNLETAAQNFLKSSSTLGAGTSRRSFFSESQTNRMGGNVASAAWILGKK